MHRTCKEGNTTCKVKAVAMQVPSKKQIVGLLICHNHISIKARCCMP